jgi:hypothetical protein
LAASFILSKAAAGVCQSLAKVRPRKSDQSSRLPVSAARWYNDGYLLGIYSALVYNTTADGISGSVPTERCPAIIIRLGQRFILGVSSSAFPGVLFRPAPWDRVLGPFPSSFLVGGPLTFVGLANFLVFVCTKELNAKRRHIKNRTLQTLRLGPVSTRLCHATASPLQTDYFLEGSPRLICQRDQTESFATSTWSGARRAPEESPAGRHRIPY